MAKDKHIYDLLVVGGSNGGMEAFIKILEGLDDGFQLPIAFVLHQQRGSKSLLPAILGGHTQIRVSEPVDKEIIQPGNIYIAPPDYHLLIEPDKTFSYSYSEPLNYSRPSIDILFETAAEAFGNKVAGLLLTGANSDGSAGLKSITNKGGLAIVQDPETARSPEMPLSAISLGINQNILDLHAISQFLNILNIDFKSGDF